MILTVTLNPALDKMVSIDEICPGRDLATSLIGVSAGGKGVNVARALKRSGVSATALVALAGPNGQSLSDGLKKEGIATNVFRLSSGDTRINLTMTEECSGRVTRLLESGPSWDRKDAHSFQEYFCRQLRGKDLVVLSGRLPPGLPSGYYAKLILEAKRQGIASVLDTSGPALKAGIKARPWAIKPNREEAEDLLGMRLSSRRAVRKALQTLLGYGMKMILLTLGRDGLALACEEGVWFARPSEMIDGHTVGCGDASLAGFLVAREKRLEPAECARWAATYGAANMESEMPGSINRNALEPMVRRIIVKRLGEKT